MIRFEGLSKGFNVRGVYRPVINELTMQLPEARSLALLGRNGAGKSTLLKLIAGILRPDAGKIVTDRTISWPVGFAGAFHDDLTGAQNVRFVARIYGADTEELMAFVEAFSEVGPYLHAPVKNYSAGMRARLAFGLSMGIPFDVYLVDEVTAVGDHAFRRKSRRVFRERMNRASAILVTHNMDEVHAFCDEGLVLDDGSVTHYHDLNAAVDHHKRLMAKG